ncbi:MAG: hypothetical protein WC702_00285 [Patescibacteria group bacterium]|jgi:hypothetical protein
MRPLRLLSFWFFSFLSIYALSFLSVLAWGLLNYNNVFLVVGMVCPPLVTLLFGWLYFRAISVLPFSVKIKNAIVWIALDFVAGAIMLAILKGSGPADIFSTVSLITEAANFFALLVAAYISVKQLEHSVKALPPSLDLRPPAQG